ncbi:MAG TPA: TIGR00730 family Rossman fold protein [Acidimicrobiales bacterium]|nr:TIGR00730 family Rossman fold protein [Acidimicrobiales bacterium]
MAAAKQNPASDHAAPEDALGSEIGVDGTSLVPPLAADEAGLEDVTEDERLDGGRERLVDELLDSAGVTARRDLYRSIIGTVVHLAEEDTDALDLKLARAAMAEMAEAFRVFRPYRHTKKVTFFGSARTLPDDPLYTQARRLAERIARDGWMVVTGAGPGIMEAAMEGAGRELSLGVNIRLPHEQGANQFIAQDPKLVEMRYFFTRKLMLIKESDGYAVLPGGFGTLDEAFELLTLLQTGKAQPAPLVLLDVPDGTYWRGWQDFLDAQVTSTGLVSTEDHALFKITSDVDEAASELFGFYRNYHSVRWVGDLLVVRMQVLPTRAQLVELNDRFADMVTSGKIRPTKPLAPERSGSDNVELPRLAMRFDRFHYGRLRKFIDALNALV